MNVILSSLQESTLTREQSIALQDEMRYAVNNVSVFPVMESLLRLMEA